MSRSESLIPIVRNVTLTSADTEYSQAFPRGTKYFSVQCRTAFDVRYAFATGHVATPTAPYATAKSNQWYNHPEKMSVSEWDSWGVTPVAEVNTVTIALTWAAASTCAIAIDGRTLLVTVGSLVTPAQVATTIKQAWQGEEFTDGTATVAPSGGGVELFGHSQHTATVSGAVVTLTADSAGERWNSNGVMVVTATTAGNGTAVLANATPAAGPSPMIYLASSEAGVVAELICWVAMR